MISVAVCSIIRIQNTQSKSLNQEWFFREEYEPPNLHSGILFINYSIIGLAVLSVIYYGYERGFLTISL
jgi:hypothetical protein